MLSEIREVLTMAARGTDVVFHNETAFALTKVEEDLAHGEWTDRWQPPPSLNPGSVGEWRSESDGIATGTEGAIRFRIENGKGASVYFHWDNPFDGTNSYHQFTDDGFEVFHIGGDGNNTRTDVFLRPSAPHFIPGFKPSANGFKFTNNWGDVPYSLPPLRGSLLDFKYGNANNGLCGGMVYTVRDYYEASRLIPSDTTRPPGETDSLFMYIVNRLFDSFDVNDVSLYLKLMNPLYPDTDENLLNPIGLANGRAFVMANIEFPMIRADILTGHPSPLGLVRVKSALPFDLGNNHQVLAYGYQQSGENVTIWLYDPNTEQADSDTVKMSFNVRTTAERINVAHNVDGGKGPIYCFFRTNYQFSKPLPSIFSLRLYGESHGLDLGNGVRAWRVNNASVSRFRKLT
jgi:hypothetical protein